MMKRAFPIALFLGLAMVLPVRAQDAAIKIAVANTARIFNEMQETRDLKQKLEGERKRLENEERERKEKIQSLRDARNLLKSDSPQYQQKNRELLEEAIKFDVWGKMLQAEVQRNQRVQMKHLFDKIQAAVNEVAAKKGFDLVLSDQRPEIPEDPEQMTLDQLRAMINARTVLYAGPKVDITNDVLALLNAKYTAGKADSN